MQDIKVFTKRYLRTSKHRKGCGFEFLVVKKSAKLPLPMIIIGDQGDFVLRSLEPAGPEKLGATDR